MSGRRFSRRLLRVAGLIVGIMLLLGLLLPLWFPWVLPPLAAGQSIRYQTYTRAGYSRFVLAGFGLTNGSTIVQARRVEAFVPTVWLWRLTFHRAPAVYLRVDGWHYESRPEPRAAQRSVETSLYHSFQSVAGTLNTLRRWVPAASLSDGSLRIEQTTCAVPQAIWTNGLLRARIAAPAPASESELLADLSHGPPYTVQARSVPLGIDSSIKVLANAAGLELQSSWSWGSNHLEFAAEIEKSGTLPVSARLDARDLRIPAARLGIPQYQAITGSVTGNWAAGRFAMDVRAQALPLTIESNLPALNLTMHASGDTNTVAIEQATLDSVFLQAVLSRPLQIHFHGPLLTEPAHLTLAADLGKQSWFPLTGRVAGEADLSPGTNHYPSVRFRLTGSDLAAASVHARDAMVQGELEWPELQLTSADATFDDSSTTHLSGGVDLTAMSFTNCHVDFRGPFLRRWLPQGYGYAALAVSTTFSGPLVQLRHQGVLDAKRCKSPSTPPVDLHLEWTGTSTNELGFDLIANTVGGSLSASGDLTNVNATTELALTKLSLATNGHPALELAAPCRFALTRSAANLHLGSTAWQWSGPAGELHGDLNVDWPDRGRVQLGVSRISTGLIAPFVTNVLPSIQVRQLAVDAGWTNGPAVFNLTVSADETQPAGLNSPPIRFNAMAQVSGGPAGMTLSNLVITSQTSQIVVAHGRLPLRLQPGSSNWFQLQTAEALEFAAEARPQAFFWDQLATWTGVRLRDPQLHATVDGTWREPRGRLLLGARGIEIQKVHEPALHFQNLRLAVDINRDQAQLTRGEVLLQGQPVTLTGAVPLGQSFWENLPHGAAPSWTNATGRLRITDAELANFEPLFPSLLAPQGDLNADLTLTPGGNLAGELKVRNARSRPLASAGPLRNIQFDLRLRNRLVELADASVRIGGASVAIGGHVDLQGTNWLSGGLPPFELSVTGADVPLSREPESIIRSDLVLSVTHTNGASPLVSGAAHLRDSFFLSDLRDLIPVRVASPSRRPPYFSIEEPSLADWRLAVQVDGARFLKVRSSLFNGEVTANLKLQGTLKDPIALGDLKIDSGIVRFPFASLQVQQGLVVLTSQDPYRPQLTVNAASKQFGYDLRMDVTGPVDGPILQFNSSPPLSSDQILLMVTAGELPQGTFSLTPQQKAQTVAMFLGRDVLSKFGLGDQTQQRLTIRSGEEITEQGRPTYHVEYKLTDRWSIEGEYDRFGDFNAGFLWRIYSK